MEATIFNKKTRSSSPTIAMHKQSYSITKPKPKIRIIHVFAPEIIKTDVANFRELVQNLTGKPNNRIKASKAKPNRDSHCINMEKLREHDNVVDQRFSSNFELRDDQQEISLTWNGNNVGGESYNGGFLNGFGDFEGFIQELGDFPYLPLSMDVSASSNSSSSSLLHGGSFFSDFHHQFS